MKIFKKSFAVMLCLLMVMSIIPLSASAAEPTGLYYKGADVSIGMYYVPGSTTPLSSKPASDKYMYYKSYNELVLHNFSDYADSSSKIVTADRNYYVGTITFFGNTDDFKVTLEGVNALTGKNDIAVFEMRNSSLTITGSDNASLVCNSLVANQGIKITNVNISSNNTQAIITSSLNNDVVFENSVLSNLNFTGVNSVVMKNCTASGIKITSYCGGAQIDNSTFNGSVIGGKNFYKFDTSDNITGTMQLGSNSAVTYNKAQANTHLLSGGTVTFDLITSAAAEYSITVTNGTASPTKAKAGETITLTANAAPEGTVFNKWVVTGATVANATSATTTFVMPEGNVSATAIYKEKTVTPPSPDDPSPDVPSTGNSSLSIATPSQTNINYKDGIVLHATAQNLPAGAKIEWSANNNNFTTTDDSYGSLTAISNANGATVFTAKIKLTDGTYAKGADGNEIKAEVTLNSKAGFFQKIIGFFKGLFGLTKIHE